MLERDVDERLDGPGRQLLDAVQRELPLTGRPWAEIGRGLGLSGEEVLARLRRLREEGVVRKLGPVISARKVGLRAATLVAMKVPSKRLSEIVGIINGYDEVSHNYERDHLYNVWFTLTAPDRESLSQLLSEIHMRTGIPEEDVLNLPTERLLKVRVNFNMGGA